MDQMKLINLHIPIFNRQYKFLVLILKTKMMIFKISSLILELKIFNNKLKYK